MNLRLFASCLGMLLLLATAAGHAVTFGSFEAEYRIRHGSLTVGKATVSFKVDAKNQYRYASRSEATGITALFVSETIDESSAGNIANNALTPHQYVYHRRGKKSKAKTENIRFDWNKNQLIDLPAGKPWRAPLKPGAVDRHTVQLLLMRDLMGEAKTFSYTIADDHQLKTWSFQVKGKDTINTPAGRFKAIIVKRLHNSKKRATEMWCAPELGNLPVMIEHQKGGDTEFYMELVKISGKPIK